jgi:flagellin-like hook-associated protein FlgL
MTLNQLAAGLQNAIASASGLGIRNSEAKVVSTVQSGISGLGGYIQLTSGTVGEMGDFSIAGDQAVMDALGINVTRESVNNVVQVRSQDVNGNVRTINTSSDRASGLLNGCDMIFDNTAAQIAGHGGIVDGIKFSANNVVDFNFDVYSSGNAVSKNVSITFNADECWSLDNIAATINQEIENSAGAETGMQASVVDGQIRLSYTPNTSHPTIQSEITINQDAGSIGFISGTYTGFVDGDKSDEYSIKGVSVLDTAAGSTPLKINIASITGSAGADITFGNAVAVGTKDLLEVNQLVISANRLLTAAGVAARVDIHDGSIAFTSTTMGTLHRNTQADVDCKIIVNSTGSLSTGDLSALLGYKDGTARGTGDTNFRLRVVDNSPMLQIGANEGQNMQVAIGDMSARALGIDRLDMSTVKGAQDAIGKLDNALSRVSAERSKLGAYSNRLDYTMNNLENTATNLSDAESRIRDVDMASEMINFTSAQIMQQAGTAMLAQANSMGQSVLSLLG